MRRVSWLSPCFVVLCGCVAHAFTATRPTTKLRPSPTGAFSRRRGAASSARSRSDTTTTGRLWASGSRSSGSENGDNLEALRQALESSWNVESMGVVPTSPESAAEAAATAIRNARLQDVSLTMVDILLPQYDASQSDKVYDEVLATEFCIALAKELKEQASIVVRDNKTIETVRRILDRREEASLDKEASVLSAVEEDDSDDEDDEDDDEEDDSAAVDLIEKASTDDVDSFRAKLAADWDKESSTANIDGTTKETKMPRKESAPVAPPKNKGPAPKNLYRLCSMLGDAVGISKGSDMQRAVMAAVKAHALPRDDEETIIILSAASPQELIGIRALVAQYQSTKHMILVNCRVTPLPRELVRAQTAYSILPLIAKPAAEQNAESTPWSSGSGSSSSNDKNKAPPKVVVLRRFPRDWEVFVDTGNGFDLAATAPASSVQQKGPSMTWIVNAVQRYLEARSSAR